MSPESVGQLRTKELALKEMSEVRKLRTESARIIEARKLCGLKESTNYMLSLPCDLYK